jgi:hypothetical protein
MPIVFGQERHHGIALRRATQSAAFQGTFDRLGIHEEVRLYLISYFVETHHFAAVLYQGATSVVPQREPNTTWGLASPIS